VDVRQYLVRAQRADAIANAATTMFEHRRWEEVAAEYRRLAKIVAAEWGKNILGDSSSLEH